MAGSGRRRRAEFAAVSVVLLVVPACGLDAGGEAVLGPDSQAGRDIEVLWWGMFATSALVFAVTMTMLAVAVRRRGRPGNRFILLWGFGMTVTVLLGLLAATIVTGVRVYVPPSTPALTVDVIAHQFWWEIRYPDGTVTANELHIPVGEPVSLTLLTDDVIHSFWVPELHGKMDMIPGRRNQFWITADRPGVYEGVCAEFCGIQHAKMRKLVVAQPRHEFERWLGNQRAEAVDPAGDVAEAGREVFLGSSCVQCHAIRGVTPPAVSSDAAVMGPDLTHLASRRTIAAGILPNERGWLGGWILDPQSHKPGARMPASDLDGAQLQALLTYLEELR